MTRIQDIIDYTETFAPLDTAMDFDNSGLLLGSAETEVTGVLLALDITSQVVREAVKKNCQLIISHHPVIFIPVSSLDSKSIPYLLAQNSLSALCLHTNLDIAESGGVCRCLAEAAGLCNLHFESGEYVIVTGELEKTMTTREFAAFVRDALGCERVMCTLPDKPIKKVAVCSGAAGSDYISAFRNGADAYLTGEVRHHEYLAATELGLAMVNAGHFETEDIVIEPLRKRLSQRFPEVGFFKAESLSRFVSFI